MQSLVSARPSVGPYWSAFAHDSCAMRCATAANVSGGKVLVSGSPPASEITSGRAVTAIRSRIADDFMTCVREAKRPAYRSRSRLVERGRPRRGPSSTVTALQGTERPHRYQLLLDIGQGTGLASASGVRPFLPPILAGSLGRADLGVNFSGGDFAFLESIPFIAVMVVLAIAVVSS